MTFLDWREPVRILEMRTGTASEAQRGLARTVGLRLNGDEPHCVASALLDDYLRPLIWSTESEPATDSQRRFLSELGGVHATDPELTKSVASAWIDHQLSLRTIASLNLLAPTSGDAVIRRRSWRNPESGTIIESLDCFIVSSIGANGLVYFKGGNGACGWPSSLRRIYEDEDPATFPQYIELSAE